MTANLRGSISLLALAVTLALGGPSAGYSAEKQPDKKSEEAPAVLKRPDWGKVSGWVLDCMTRKPISGARVAVEIGGAFPESGKSTDATDEYGKYTVRAPLGSISSKFDWGRLLTMHPLSLVLDPRAVTKQTKMLDVTQVNVRVEAEGHRPFVGRVRATLADARSFSVTLDDVWLAPERGGGASFSPERVRLEVIESLKVEPYVASPGEKVTISLTTRLPVERGLKYKAQINSTGIRLVDDELELKAEKNKDDTDRVVFTREVKLPKSTGDRFTELTFTLIRDDTVILRQREMKALLQVVANDGERAAAEKVAEAFALSRIGEKDRALQALDAARKRDPNYTLAHQLAGDTLLQLNRPEEAARAYARLAELDPTDYDLARPRLATALLESGKAEEALKTIGDVEKRLGKRKFPPYLAVARARAFASFGNFEEADKWLSKAGAEIRIPEESLLEINLKRMVAAVREKPKDADLRLAYARVLDAARRREDAIAQMREAIRLDSSQPWAFLDLGLALRQSGRLDEGAKNLEHALALAPDNVEAIMAVAELRKQQGRYPEALAAYQSAVDRQKLNLRARHNLALMLLVAGKTKEAQKELLEVINQARSKGDLIDDALPLPYFSIYFGPKKRYSTGFSVPEAAADAAILEALQDLGHHPDNALLWQNIGNAMLELNEPAMAVPSLQKSLELDTSMVETRFLLAVAQRKLGDAADAQKNLQAVLTANPMHPRARLELAQLYSDTGRLEQAQAQVLAHIKHYPYERVPGSSP